MSSSHLKMLPTKYQFINHKFDVIYKQDLAVDNLQMLICYTIQPTTFFFFTVLKYDIMFDEIYKHFSGKLS